LDSDYGQVVKPDTVTGWRLTGFRLYWRWRSRPRSGRPKIIEEIRTLIQRLARENPDDRIHDSLTKDAPNGRPIEQKPSARSGGLQHRYFWEEAT
jgi:hypothetical protein